MLRLKPSPNIPHFSISNERRRICRGWPSITLRHLLLIAKKLWSPFLNFWFWGDSSLSSSYHYMLARVFQLKSHQIIMILCLTNHIYTSAILLSLQPSLKKTKITLHILWAVLIWRINPLFLVYSDLRIKVQTCSTNFSQITDLDS